jgi:membrane protease YdiL (CAAX protease family)
MGIPIGVGLQLVMVPLVFFLMRQVGIDTSSSQDPARQLVDSARGVEVALLMVLVVVGAPLIEELFFRGLLLRSIQARYSDAVALVGSAVAFGAAHAQPLQVPALVLFGLAVGYAAQRTRRLGLSTFIHAGFNATTVVLLLARRS